MWGGAGSALHPAVLGLAALCTLVATGVSALGVYQHLKNYRRPALQRMVIRILLMVPIYAMSSLVSLVSLEAAFVIDALRDIYEAFVIYCFFNLLIGYLGGERALLISLHGRPPKYHVFPVSLLKHELDASDPYVFLALKRGIMQYVQIKPILAVATVVLKAVGKYDEGDFRLESGYLYVTIVYNISIFVALYCLAMFWSVVNDDLKPFRPMPKFLCVKGILFFSFWQSLAVSILVAAGVVRRLGPYGDAEHISLALTDMLICLEMPFFALAHMLAFAARDFEDPNVQYAARVRIAHALRDACGARDLVEDFRATGRGDGFAYRAFEPAGAGALHQGAGRARRIRAGLRYAQGGKKKYWLPTTPDERARSRGPYAPLPSTPDVDDDAQVHGERNDAPDHDPHDDGDDDAGLEQLAFDPPDADEDALYAYSRGMLFGDYGYPVVDVSRERARAAMWAAEERILRDERAAAFSPAYGTPARYGAVDVDADASRSRVFGALADAYPVPPHSSATASWVAEPSAAHAPVIDFAHDRIPDMGSSGSGVRLSWARTSTPRVDASRRQSLAAPVFQSVDDLAAEPEPDVARALPQQESRRTTPWYAPPDDSNPWA